MEKDLDKTKHVFVFPNYIANLESICQWSKECRKTYSYIFSAERSTHAN